MNPASQTLEQLDSARSLALSDGRYYPTIIPGVLPIISANTNANLDIRRWGADFLAETFASPTFPTETKESSSLQVLETVKSYLETVDDSNVVKSAVQAAASIYPLVYRHTATDPNDVHNWQTMSAIKSNILRRMDTAPPGVRICCVKFVQQVILVETPGYIADPRRLEQNDISLALVPRDHPLLPQQNLEAEASGLLDRLLDIIHGDQSDALLVTATLNSLGTIIQRRPSVANKILSSVLNFNPLKLANSPMTPKNKVVMRSIERTTRALLVNTMKRHPENPLNGRIQQYLERMHRMRLDVFDESNRKRPAPVEPTDGLDQAKRQRLGADVPGGAPAIPPLPAGPVSLAQLFTLTSEAGAKSFDVQAIPVDLVVRIVIPILQSIDPNKLDNAINAIRTRYLALGRAQPRTALDGIEPGAAGQSLDDEDEYEPDFEPVEDAEQIINRMDSPPDSLLPARIPDAPLAPFKLPQAPPMTEQEIQKHGEGTVSRLFGFMSSIEEPTARARGLKPGFNRFAASNGDQNSWVTIIARLATRASAGLENLDASIKSEHDGLDRKGNFSLSEMIRRSLYTYIMYDWRKRIEVAISWLSEEWYNDAIQRQASQGSENEKTNGNTSSTSTPPQHYRKWVLKLLDAIVPFVEGNDKAFIRFLSEIPQIDHDVLRRVKKLADDPDRVNLTIMALQYLYMFKPPVRGMCVDVLEDLWKNNDEAKPQTKKLLMKWRPEALKDEPQLDMANGSLDVKPVEA